MIEMACPHCAQSYCLPDNQAGKKLRCKHCQQAFTVEDPLEELPVVDQTDGIDEVVPVEEPASPARLRPGPPLPPRPRDEDNEDRDRPRLKKRGNYRDDDDLDDYDDTPRRQGGGGLLVPLLIGLGVFLVLLVGAGVAIVVALSAPGQAPPVAEAPNNPPPVNPPPVNPPRPGDAGKRDGGRPNPPEPPPPPPKVETLDDAIKALTETDDQRRTEAITFLMTAQPEPGRIRELARAVVPLLRDFRHANNAETLLQKWVSPPVRDELIALVEPRESSPTLRRTALRLLGHYQDDDTLACLVRLLEDPFLYRDAATHLKRAGSRAEKHLVALMYHKQRRIRDVVAPILAELKGLEQQQLAQTLLALSSEDREIKLLALRWLSSHKPTPDRKDDLAAVSQALEPLIKGTAPDIRKAALNAFADWASPESVPLLAELLEKGGVPDMCPLIQAAGRLKDERTFRYVMLRLGNPTEREDVVRALIAFGPPVEELVQVQFANRDPNTVSSAVKILAEIGTEKSIKPLEQLRRRANPLLVFDINDAVKKIRARVKPPTP